MQVYYNGEGFILIELHGAALELSRAEAEQLFVDLGNTLQDMDVKKYVEESTHGLQPHEC